MITTIKLNPSIRKSIIFIGLGVMNLFHAGLHVIQFFQSFLILNMVSHNHNHHSENIFTTIIYSPIFSGFWVLIGLITLWIGVKDFIHHKKCKH